MSKISIPLDGSFGPLSPYVDVYLAQIKKQGYAVGSVYEQVHLLELFGGWLEQGGYTVSDLNETVTGEFLRGLKEGYSKKAAPVALRRLLGILRQIGATPAAQSVPLSACEEIISVYERFLLEERGLAWQSVVHLRRWASTFMSETFDETRMDLSQLGASDVTAFVQRHAHRHSPENAGQLVAATRSFLRFLHYKGLIGADLSLAVPKVAGWALSTVPKHLSAAQVREVLSHCDRSTGLGRRNYAILLLLARLGLRACEVIGLNLEDIDWENARITVRGKGKSSQLPLPADVAQAIADYLRWDRRRCDCRRVFLRNYAPVGGIRRSVAIAKIVKHALAKAGVVSPRKGAHLLRHSLATDMLNKGASLAEIAEVLRHKSPDSTAIYAKVDRKSLHALALPWPGGVR